MATIKSYTDIEQSKKLARILLLDSADMWHHGFFNPSRMCKIEYNPPAPYHSVTHQWDCPCWSLAALLDVLPEHNLQRTDWENKTEYKIVVYVDDDNYASKNYDNPVDACVAMIEKLHELKML